MPNQRSDRKRIVSAYVEDDLKDALKAIADREGKTLTDVLTEIIKERVENAKCNNRSN